MPTFRLFYARHQGCLVLVLNWETIVPKELDDRALASLSRFIRAKATRETLEEAEEGVEDIIARHFRLGELEFILGRWRFQERARFAALMH